MFFNQKVENPMLCGAIEAFKADRNDQKRMQVVEEILKAYFLCPCTVSERPVLDENGEPVLPDGCEISPKMIQDKEGRPLLLAFTNEQQMEKWQEQRTIRDIVYPFATSFLEYASFMLQQQEDGSYGPAQGFVIDPYGDNYVVDRDMVANMLVRLQMRSEAKEKK
ncbi:MAG: SseB family protein [Lachnospiraceae bacterium]|nr:SseB family protein [Lachnospiraceae bacterium]